MPIVHLILLPLFFSSLVSSNSCLVGGQCSSYVNDTYLCTIIPGIFSNQTCEAQGYVVGSCCIMNGRCIKETLPICTIFDGSWSDNEECVCEDTASSCCLGERCVEDMDQTECEENDGRFYEHQNCDMNICPMQEEFRGACCVDSTETCFDVPKEYCGGIWHSNVSCAELGCYPRSVVPVLDDNSTYPGRCCSMSDLGESCIDISPSECLYPIYQDGLGCTSYPCFPLGVCTYIEYGNLQCSVSHEMLCLKGSFVEGGTCEVSPLGSCVKGNQCENSTTRTYCSNYEGTVWNKGELCDDVSGACVDPSDNECMDMIPIIECSFLHTYYPNQTCTEIDLGQPGRCCFFSFCFSLTKPLCSFLGAAEYEIGSVCPYSDTCGEVEFSDDNVNITLPINIRNTSFSSINSTLTLDETTMYSIDLSLETSTLNIHQNFTISHSHMTMNGNSNLIIDGCLDISSLNLTIKLNNIDLEKLKNGKKIELASFKCLIGTFLSEMLVDDQADACVQMETTPNALSLFYDDNCGDTDDVATDPKNIHWTIVMFIIILLAVIVVCISIFSPIRDKILPYKYRKKK